MSDIRLVSKARGCDPVFHEADVIDHPNASVQNLEDLIDLHPALALP
jgi:hypothetical protein